MFEVTKEKQFGEFETERKVVDEGSVVNPTGNLAIESRRRMTEGSRKSISLGRGKSRAREARPATHGFRRPHLMCARARSFSCGDAVVREISCECIESKC